MVADKLIRATAADGGIRAVGAITTSLTEVARNRHQMSCVATAALGRAMTAGLLLASSMKTEASRVNLRFKGNGPMGGLLVDAGANGTVRGFVSNPTIELPLNDKGKLDVGRAVGAEGFLYVVRDVGYGFPYSSTVELISGEIGGTMGLLIQVMPKAARDESLVSLLESRITALSGFTPLLQAGKSLPDILEELLGDLGLEIFPEVQMLHFHCGCSSERMLGALKLLGEAELADMIKVDRGAEATCDFCNEVYHATESDLTQLVDEIRSSVGIF
jgi:molecular chaperone Hsp33